MTYIQCFIVFIYALFLVFIFLYSLVQLSLTISYVRSKIIRTNRVEKPINNHPFVTVQLPVFNEKYVVKRLLDCIVNFDYPKDKFEIQILDDSTDETVEIIADKIKTLEHHNIEIHHITRINRQGYKAGALKEAMATAKGEFIAIFDADFLPKKDFLVKTISEFEQGVGVVQTKWMHLNKKYSLLTRLQAFGLDAHFTVEQSGRNAAGHFINFNGTAGVWRTECIEDAGGWESDTLTEDLDLSYRAQLKGWEFKYLETYGSPAELPANMNALKTQQFRWTKGAAECTRKNLVRVLASNNVKLKTKIHAIFHLMNSFLFICIFGAAMLSVPILAIKHQSELFTPLFKWGALFSVSFLFLSVYYFSSSFYNSNTERIKNVLLFPFHFPMFLAVSMGLSLHNAIAVFEGYIGKKTPFVRTPKFNITGEKGAWKGNNYLTKSLNLLTLLEGACILYFLYGIYYGIQYEDYGMVPFHLMLVLGFLTVFTYSIYHSLKTK